MLATRAKIEERWTSGGAVVAPGGWCCWSSWCWCHCVGGMLGALHDDEEL